MQLSEKTAMPLEPGTVPVCSGECFKCRKYHRRSDACRGRAIPRVEEGHSIHSVTKEYS
ncbi:hypothetical protein GYMLUDRAFT_781225 [Collybiopsis luxurians FD-317 M1]|uniref:Uncharacterized protein n=1 Tax=Collybiopsis luxurians FD-317 M1 TaxID=944289 RepID=A0A0D0C2Y0_9AGAR|nr:hypothetical protein GYMLUDRAFT_781225 [Collybiopsis luxurians FD-317 M1]